MLLALALATPWASGAQPAPEPRAAVVEARWIIERLRRPTPTRTPFVEVRDSTLLKTPLRIEGEYVRPDAATFVRRVTAPYVETTTIRAGEATIARAGRTPRRFSLSRVPELAGLQASFGALLAGDLAAVERTYRIRADGTRGDWHVTLVPRDPALAAKVHEVLLHGRGAELRCIETRPAGGEVQRTLLAGAAQQAAGVVDGATLARLCGGVPAR